MKKVVVTFNHFRENCPEAVRILEENGFALECSQSPIPYFTYEQYCETIGDVDVLIAGLDTLDERIFSIAPRLKLVALMGVGYERIDLESARRHGIKVTTTRGGNAEAVAEQALGMILAVLRNLVQLDQSLHQGQWSRYVGRELRGKTVGLVGFGDIAQRLAKLLQGFDVKILACKRNAAIPAAAGQLGVTITDFQTVLRESDVVSVHVPGSKDNQNLIGAAELATMKHGAILINTSRGVVVDSSALLEAVRSGHLAGAGVDVYEPEPPKPEEPALQDPRILCTPHSASETQETFQNNGALIARQILDTFAGYEPENWINR